MWTRKAYSGPRWRPGGRPASAGWRIALLAFGFCLGAGLGMIGPGLSGAAAQSWFDGLFQPFQPQPPAYRTEIYRPARPVVRRPRPKPRPVAETPIVKPAVPASRFVAVIGDSLGQLLAQGLSEALADRPDVGILHKARESTGLVRDDYFDWIKEARDLLETGEKIDVAVMLIGSNDRQSFRAEGTGAELLSPKWKEVYAARVRAIATLFRDHKVPLIWVGLPIMKSDRFSADMSGFNDMYREQATAAGATYIDIWEAFGDERGQYSAFGPNIDGQIVRLRAADGVHFTKAGARKLAHFVEADVRRLIDRPSAPGPAANLKPMQAPSAPRDEVVAPPAEAVPAPVPVPIAGPVLPLTAPALAPGAVLATKASAGAQDAAATLIDRALIQGQPITPKPGRADDHRWPQP